jgi:hypothetical protein
MASTLTVDTIQSANGLSSNVATINLALSQLTSRPYAEFAFRAGDGSLTVAASTPVKVPITRTNVNNKITLNSANSEWTHSETGYYKITWTYRQDSGSDYWTQYAVLKNSNKTSPVGVSLRCGSVNSSHPATYPFMYYVDDTSAQYQLWGWSAGTIAVYVTSGFGGTTSAWSVYGGTGGTSDVHKMIIEKMS